MRSSLYITGFKGGTEVEGTQLEGTKRKGTKRKGINRCRKQWMARIMVLAIILNIGFLYRSNVQAAPKGYVFAYKGASVQMGGKANKLLKKAGEPEKKKVSKSCAYDGKDRIYQYKDFILSTYSEKDDGPEYVNGITFRTDDVSTKEGIRIGDSLEDVEKAYGKTEEDLGVYNYVKGSCRLQFMVSDGKVVNIRYQKK